MISWNRKDRLPGRTDSICLTVAMILLTGSQAMGSDLVREFVWKSFGEVETLMVKVPTALHTHYAHKGRSFQYGNYVKEDAGFEFTARLAEAFDDRAAADNLSEWDKLNMVVDFVQSLEYQTEVGEYPKYPIETLKDGGGDCEDTSILLAAILDQMGIDCILLSPPGHMAVGLAITGHSGKHYVYMGKKYYYVETTGKNWAIGLIPDSHTGTAKIYALPGQVAERRTVVAKDVEMEAGTEETMIMVSFHRNANGEEDPLTHATIYRYTAHLETDPTTLSEVLEVQYRRLEPGKEPGKIPWLRAYDVHDKFETAWTATQYVPVQVRIFFKDGSYVQTMIDFAPKISGR